MINSTNQEASHSNNRSHVQECICFNSTILFFVLFAKFASIRGIVKNMYYLFTSVENSELEWKDKARPLSYWLLEVRTVVASIWKDQVTCSSAYIYIKYK